MSKNSLKRAKKLLQVKHELSYLLPAFSFLVQQQKSALEAGATGNEDYMIILTRMIRKLKSTTSLYTNLHKEVIEIVNKIIFKHEHTPNIYFLVGLSLISYHNEMRSKVIPTGLSDDADTLFDIFSSEDDTNAINRNVEYTELLVNDIKEYYKEDKR